MNLILIAAHDPNLVIGKDGELPWHYPEDLKHFKQRTMGHAMLMGRVVFEEINETPLPGRKNVVLSRTRDYDQVPTFSSVEAGLEYLGEEDQIFIIGGETIYRQLLEQADFLYITEIHQSYEGDTFFPEYREDVGPVWEEIYREDHEQFSFVDYKRID